MKAIMISIRPEWIQKILNGEKTIEIRKTKPKCELPVKVYIYCTKNNGKGVGKYPFYQFCDNRLNDLNGKVVAEFTLNEVEKIKFDCPCSFSSFNMGFGFAENRYNIDVTKTCLTESQLYDYLGEPFEIQGEYHKTFEFSGYAWHIDNLKIYDKPKDIADFTSPDYFPYDKPRFYFPTPLRRPPQSWCYVDELEEV